MVKSSMISKNYVAVDKSDSVSHLIGRLKLKKEKEAVVLDKDKDKICKVSETVES